MKFYGTKDLLEVAMTLAGYGYDHSEDKGVHTYSLNGGLTVAWNPDTAALTLSGSEGEKLRWAEQMEDVGSDVKRNPAARGVAARLRRSLETQEVRRA